MVSTTCRTLWLLSFIWSWHGTDSRRIREGKCHAARVLRSLHLNLKNFDEVPRTHARVTLSYTLGSTVVALFRPINKCSASCQRLPWASAAVTDESMRGLLATFDDADIAAAYTSHAASHCPDTRHTLHKISYVVGGSAGGWGGRKDRAMRQSRWSAQDA